MKRVVALLLVLVAGTQAHAATEQNIGEWSGIFLQGKVSEHWGWAFDDQVRLQNGSPAGEPQDPQMTRGNRFLANFAVRYMPRGDGSLQFHAAYGFTPTWSPSRTEHRLWQQALWQHDGDALWISGRARFEERWIENITDGPAFRARVLGRVSPYVMADKRLAIALWDEFFWNVNSVGNGPAAGFDQNWIFAGLNLRLNDKTRLEAGYMNIYYAKGSAPTAVDSHIGALFAFFDF